MEIDDLPGLVAAQVAALFDRRVQLALDETDDQVLAQDLHLTVQLLNAVLHHIPGQGLDPLGQALLKRLAEGVRNNVFR